MGKDNHKNNPEKSESTDSNNLKEAQKDTSEENSRVKEAQKREADEKMSILISEFEELTKKARQCDEYYDKLLRLGAEFDNARKRMAKEKEELIKFAAGGLILEILPIVDDFDRLIEGIKDSQINGGVLAGIKMIQKRLHELLQKNGLSRMQAVGEKFDPAKHEALMTTETDEYPEGTIIEEVRSGYFLHDRVLRHAVVKVARHKTTDTPDEKPVTSNQ